MTYLATKVWCSARNKFIRYKCVECLLCIQTVLYHGMNPGCCNSSIALQEGIVLTCTLRNNSFQILAPILKIKNNGRFGS